MKSASILATIALAAVASEAAVSYAPVTAGATGGAQKLYNFLATHYGVKTISGVMTGDVGSGTDVKLQVDVDTLFRKSGKYPALVGFDFLFATGVKASDSWYKSYTNTTLAQAKDLWSKGGIPAFTWHWKDPSDSIDAFYTKSGNPKEYTTFDFTKGFKAGTSTWDSTSSTYKQLVSDIDEIAATFLSLQKDSVAAIFRPLHEASGGWFWWGTKGGAAYQALYNLVHDRMVDSNGVKNLVWVWNPNASGDISWNPGATQYDVISLDIYGAYDYTKKFVSGYQELTTNFGTANKIFAVSENGPIPDASTMKKNNAVYSWWMPWYQSWGSKFLDQTVDAVWKANMADPCVITLDEMPGWSAYALSNAPVAACANGYALGGLDSARQIVEKFPADTATNGWLQVKYSTPADDTAKGNIIIASGAVPDLSAATTLTLKVVNGNPQSGIWFTVAFLGNAATSWGWAQPDGCWINAGDSTTCTIDLTTTTKDKVVLKGADYATFMSNINKVYIEVFGTSYSGSIFFDNVVAGSTVINKFDKNVEILSEQTKNLVVAQVIGHGSQTAVKPMAKALSDKIRLQGRTLQLSLAHTGDVSVDMFDLQGHRVANLHEGALSAGIHSLELGRVKAGVYVVRAKGAGVNEFRKVIVE
ncbi:MAG: T9SS type A sorting domain-containing protein [Fibrobacterota bacterium]|nr:T9SS type A sorting domain-containing protein [Fibrobacterota bacterium]QQS06990.1 MAG: T9SS type A sorting domain-containing protein [Fibrobacterota bacterium]